MNEAIATVGNNALVLDTPEETSLESQVSVFEEKVNAVVIKNQAGYEGAAELVKEVKRVQKQVTDYWEPLRVNAKAAYDAVLARKKEMLTPLDRAEKVLKKKMGDYTLEVERKRREAEEALRRAAEAEISKKLDEAAEAEASGDVDGAEYAMAEAEVLEGVSIGGDGGKAGPKAAGVSQSKSWEITEIDPDKVPVSIMGAVIRPVDEKAVMRIIKASKGTIQIPGIKYKETVNISVRS